MLFAWVGGERDALFWPTVNLARGLGLDNVRFLAPVPAGARVTASFVLKEIEDKGPKGQLLRLSAVLNIEGSEKPAIIGDVLALVMG